MSASPTPGWFSELVFTDLLREPPAYRIDLVPGAMTISKTVVMQRAKVQIHSKLPPVDAWTYDGSYPGPTFVVRRGQIVEVTWVNAIEGRYPVRVVKAKAPAAGAPLPQNEPGDSGGHEVTEIPSRSRTVVHLHGGKTQADSDGWPDNALANGHAAVSRYEVGQQAALLWYHDHAMGITRYNVFAGLAGLWLIRDQEELELIGQGSLPGHDHELVLSIQDRNLATTDSTSSGPPSHQFLHKIDEGTGEFFGPFTLVNGTIWPRRPVEPRVYRVRVLNSSNARAYGLELRYVDHGNKPTTDAVPAGAVRQIGTDGGLLPTASPAPQAPDGLGPLVVLAPAERVDLLIDFGLLAASSSRAGVRVAWFNTANAPYDGGYLAPEAEDDGQGNDRASLRLQYPQVMRFDIAAGATVPSSPLPVPLSKQYCRYSRKQVGTNPVRFAALVELDMPTGGTMLFLRELFETSEIRDGCHALLGGPIPVEVHSGNHRPRVYRILLPGESTPREYFVAAQNFYDKANWMVQLGDFEEWRFLNLTGDTHPMHVHLVQFQVLDRTLFQLHGHTPADAIGDLLKDACKFPTHEQVIEPGPLGPTAPKDGSPDAGWKDTVRVDPNEMVAVAAKFEPYLGRYLYHCHVVEHEDSDMMRHFVVAAEMGGMHPGEMLPAQHSGRARGHAK